MNADDLDALKARVDSEGLCAQTDPEVFFPELGGTARPAKAVCLRCAVQDNCLTWAMETREPYGVWGGMSERDRMRYRAYYRTNQTTTTTERQAA